MRATLPIALPYPTNVSIAVGLALGRVCLAEGTVAEVRCFDSSGSETRIRWPAVHVRIPRAEMAAWVEQQVDRYALMMGGEARARDIMASLDLPDQRPFLTGLVVDKEGNLWVELPSEIDSEGQSKVYRVFDETGYWLSDVRVPNLEVLEIGRDYLLGISRDELDVEYVQLFPIAK